ncbi:MAG: CPCC family cysteine-rich protein [Bacilli bacterium]|jgi:hypothetical protein|nr:CPCC family cysteine-rich protein [Bacilli bacterium]
MKKNEKHQCPVCKETIIDEEFEICSVCGWGSNLAQNEESDFEEGPNKLSLNQTKEWFKLKRTLNPNYTWIANAQVDGNPTKEDLEKLKEVVKNIL